MLTSGEPDGALRRGEHRARLRFRGGAGTLGRAVAVRATPLGHTQLSRGEPPEQNEPCPLSASGQEAALGPGPEREGCAWEVLCLLEPAPAPLPRCLVLPGEPQTQEVAEWCGWGTRLGSWLHHVQAGDLGQPPPSPEPPFSHPKTKDSSPPGAGAHMKTGKTHTALNTCQAQSKRSVNGVCPSHSQFPVLSIGSGGRRGRGCSLAGSEQRFPGGQGSGPDA